MKLVNPWAANGDTAKVVDAPAPTIDPSNQIIITLNPDGSVSVTGPIMNKLLCYGMLESAKQLVTTYTPAKVS